MNPHPRFSTGSQGIGGSTCQFREKEPVLPISHWIGSSKKTKNLRTASENVSQAQDTKRGHDSYHMEKKGTWPVKNQHKYMTWSSESHEAQKKQMKWHSGWYNSPILRTDCFPLKVNPYFIKTLSSNCLDYVIAVSIWLHFESKCRKRILYLVMHVDT